MYTGSRKRFKYAYSRAYVFYFYFFFNFFNTHDWTNVFRLEWRRVSTGFSVRTLWGAAVDIIVLCKYSISGRDVCSNVIFELCLCELCGCTLIRKTVSQTCTHHRRTFKEMPITRDNASTKIYTTYILNL